MTNSSAQQAADYAWFPLSESALAAPGIVESLDDRQADHDLDSPIPTMEAKVPPPGNGPPSDADCPTASLEECARAYADGRRDEAKGQQQSKKEHKEQTDRRRGWALTALVLGACLLGLLPL